jgi:hypothetical protein
MCISTKKTIGGRTEAGPFFGWSLFNFMPILLLFNPSSPHHPMRAFKMFSKCKNPIGCLVNDDALSKFCI